MTILRAGVSFFPFLLPIIVASPIGAALEGTVTTPSGSPVPGALVIFTSRVGTDRHMVATNEEGRFHVPVGTVVAEPEGLPSAFRLFQNWPNPFNPTTQIEYHLDRIALVELAIFNIAGQKVRILEGRVTGPGEFQHSWDGRDQGGGPLAAGVYLYRLRADDRVLTRKMVMLDGAAGQTGAPDLPAPVGAAHRARVTTTSYSVEVSAPGILAYRADDVILAEGEHLALTVTPISNRELLATLPPASSQAQIGQILEAMGIRVGGSPESAGFASGHAAVIASLQEVDAGLTLAQVARAMQTSGIRLAGRMPSAGSLLALLRGAVRAAYQKPEHPFSALPLYFVQQTGGMLPASTPTLSDSTRLDPVRVSLLLAAMDMAAFLPLADTSAAPASQDPVEAIADAWDAATTDLPGLAMAVGTLAGTFEGGLTGLALAARATNFIAVATSSAEVYAAPYLADGDGEQVTDSPLGNRAVATLFRWVRGAVGLPISRETGASLILTESGLRIQGQFVSVEPRFEAGVTHSLDLPGGVGLEFVWVEPGSFEMGTPEAQVDQMYTLELTDDWPRLEVPAHHVTIRHGFWMAKTEMTQAVWQAVMEQPQTAAQTGPWFPAVISWRDARQLALRLNIATGDSVYRLPTEAEWEYVCRAGTQTLWSFGDDPALLAEYGWADQSSTVHEVGLKRPNPWGLHDMHGNAPEWVLDWIASYLPGDVVDPTGSPLGTWRVFRGNGEHYSPFETRSAYRSNARPEASRAAIRLVATSRPSSLTGPHANAGADQQVELVPVVLLDGSDSWGGTGLTFHWREDPANPATGLLADDAVVSPIFTPPLTGIYRFSLKVSDGVLDSKAATTVVEVSSAAHAIIDTVFGLPGGEQMEFVWIDPWSYVMGMTVDQEELLRVHDLWDDRFWNEQPAHQVTVTKGFWLARHELTEGQWEAVMGSTRAPTSTPRRPSEVTWIEVEELATKLNEDAGGEVYRLPTEAEWELAARAGTQSLWWFGDDPRELGSYEWYSRTQGGDDAPKTVATKLPSRWGLYDMYGNVAEWCIDASGVPYPVIHQVDPLAEPAVNARTDIRILRGGSYNSFTAGFARPSRRLENGADHSYRGVGGRLLRTSPVLPPDRTVRANAGPDQQLHVGEQGRLDGNDSSSERGRVLSFVWAEDPHNPQLGILSDLFERTPTFRPRLAGTYRFVLRVRDQRASTPDTVVVRVKHANTPVGRDTVFVLPGGAQMEFVRVEAGSFTMGTTPEQIELLKSKGLWSVASDAAELAHEVTITRPFWIGKYEVTQRQWEAVMGTREWRGNTQAHLPLADVSWNGFQEMARRMTAMVNSGTYRLPTEAEWEYACRAGTKTLWFFGDDEDQLDRFGWVVQDHRAAREMGTRLPNPRGLYDIYGNLQEWCLDWWDVDFYASGNQIDPAGPATGDQKIRRGGSWFRGADYARSARRDHREPQHGHSFAGARFVRTD